jgi:hypothetical protein
LQEKHFYFYAGYEFTTGKSLFLKRGGNQSCRARRRQLKKGNIKETSTSKLQVEAGHRTKNPGTKRKWIVEKNYNNKTK